MYPIPSTYRSFYVTVTAQENTKLAKVVDLHTIARITQIWSDRLQLVSVYVSSPWPHGQFFSDTYTLKIRRIHSGQFLHVN